MVIVTSAPWAKVHGLTSLDMDLIKTIEELRREKGRLERVIASLEELKTLGVGADAPVRSRRGRKSMSPKERQEVSARMRDIGPTDSPAAKLIQTKEDLPAAE
jgi:hypothetical protein